MLNIGESDFPPPTCINEPSGLRFLGLNSHAIFQNLIFNEDFKWKLNLRFKEFKNNSPINFFFGQIGTTCHGFARVKNKLFYRIADGSYIGGLPYNVGDVISLEVHYDNGHWTFSDGVNTTHANALSNVIFNTIGSGYTGLAHEEKTSFYSAEVCVYSQDINDFKLVAKWDFDENFGCIAMDCSGNQLHAVLHNTQWEGELIKHPTMQVTALTVGDYNKYIQCQPVNNYEFIGRLLSGSSNDFLWKQITPGLNLANAEKGYKLLNGFVSFERFESIQINTSVNWKENPFNNRSWQWQWHQLGFYIHLLAAHNETKDILYLHKIIEYVSSWYNLNFGEITPSEFSWHDHTTALRLRSLIYIFEYCRKYISELPNEYFNVLLNLIETHCNVLSCDKFYMKHNNHGFDQSLNLYLAAISFPELAQATEWEEIAKFRLIDEVRVAFTSDGMHVENSPSYLVGMLQRVNFFINITREYQNRHCVDLSMLVNDSIRALAYLIHPDGTLPMLGDTDNGTKIPAMNNLKHLSNFKFFEYVHSKGLRGNINSVPCNAVFEESGYAVFRDRWHNSSSFDKTIHLVFKCGFLSAFHRHDDDLNFILQGLGEQWFVDGGIYKYDEKDPARKYIRSAYSHNLPFIENAIVTRNPKDNSSSGIVDYNISDSDSWVQARSQMFKGYDITRKIHQVKPNEFVFSDFVQNDSASVLSYDLMFHIPSNKEIKLLDGNIVLIIAQSGVSAEMKFSGDCEYHFERLIATANDDVVGVQSKLFGNLNNVQTLVCKVVAKSADSRSIFTIRLND